MTNAAHLILGGLQEINLQMTKSLCSNGHNVVPSQKLCLQYRRQATIKSEDEELDIETKSPIVPWSQLYQGHAALKLTEAPWTLDMYG